MKRFTSLLLAGALGVLTMTACSKPAEPTTAAQAAPQAAEATAAAETQAAPTRKVDIELLGSSGTSYQVAVGVADIISNGNIGVRMSATGTANTAANIIEMKSKDPKQTIYMSSWAAFLNSREGTVAFEEYGPDENGRMICAFTFGNNGFVTLDPNIKTIEDMNGKKVGWDAEAVHTQHFRNVCDELGIKVDIQCLGFKDKYEALTDGIVDVVYGNFTGASETVMTPVSYLQEIALSDPIYPIPFPVELQEKGIEKLDATWPYSPSVAAAGTIEGQDAFELYGSASVALSCYADADEDLIYDITKTICENSETLGNFDASCVGLTPEQLVSNLGDIDEELIHPGALKYYKEVGLWPAK